ncbi:MAG: hypothetical protein EOO71_41605, partial [Myxococcaceae bacterium]
MSHRDFHATAGQLQEVRGIRWEVVEMGQGRGFKEAVSTFIATVFPTDTLLGALKVMERHRVRLVGVVG